MDCNEEKCLQKLLAHFARLLLYIKICLGLWPYIKNWSYLGNFNSSILHIPHNSFPDQTITVESPDKCGGTSRTWSEINGDKNCFVFDC